MWHDMMGGYGWGPGWGYYGLVHVLWWIFVVVALVALVRWLGGCHHHRGDSALTLLRERYARGEIDKAEFEERRRELRR